MSTGRDNRIPNAGTDEPASPDGSHSTIVPGSLASLETTLPPTPLKKLLAEDGATIHVSSADEGLIETIEEAGGDQYPVNVSPEWANLIDLVKIGRCKIILLDADHFGSRLEARIAELNSVASALVILVAAPRVAAQNLIGHLSDRSIHRLLIKPAAVGITRLLLESAVSRYIQLRNAKPREAAPTSPRRSTAAWTKRKLPVLILAFGLVSLLIGGVFLSGLVRFGAPDEPIDESVPAATNDAPAAGDSAADAATLPPPEATAALDNTGAIEEGPVVEPAVEPGPQDTTFAVLLARADLALSEGRLAEPAGENAIDDYAAILAANPDHELAEERLAIAVDTLLEQAQSALLDGMLDQAETVLNQIRRVQPASPGLTFLDAQLARARADEVRALAAAAAAEAAESEPAAVLPTELESFVSLARTRLQRDQLLQPAGDSTLAYLERAAAIDANDPGVVALRGDLGAAVAVSSQTAIDGGDLDRATLLIASAPALGVAEETVAQLQLNFDSALAAGTEVRQTALLERGLAHLSDGELIGPGEDNAAFALGALRAENPNFPGLDAAWSGLLEMLTAGAVAAVGAGDWDTADLWVNALVNANDDSVSLDALRANLAAGRLQEEYLQNVAEPGELRVAQRGRVDYPPAALREDIEGVVQLEFIVDLTGQPTSIRVVAADPPQLFEDAAIASVERYLFEPFERDGRVYERLARLRIRFALE